MQKRFVRAIRSLELEEQFLNGGALITLVGLFFPWLSGAWRGGDTTVYTAFGFYVSFIGFAIALLTLFLLSLTIIPLLGGPIIIRKRHREVVRLFIAIQITVLILAALSVLINATHEFSSMDVRFGVYLSLLGSIVTIIYAYLRFQEQRRSAAQEVFHHPDDHAAVESHAEPMHAAPPPPPPPPAPDVENHTRY
jgi:hypothetical protein